MNELSMDRVSFFDNCNQKVHHCDQNTNINGLLVQITSIVQNVLNNFGSILVTLYLLSSSLCLLREDVSRSYLISALLTGVGICFLMITFCSGNRFIIIGSNRLGYLVCSVMLFETTDCVGTGDIYAMGPELRTAKWLRRLTEIQGGVIITCVIQLILGFLDVNFLVKFIRPISIAPTMILIGLFVTKTSAMRMINSCWLLFTLTIVLMFCLHCVAYNSSNNKNKNLRLRNRLFVGVIGVIIMWSLCGVLSTFELIQTRSPARTDVYNGIYTSIPVLRYSFPFQWGVPEWKIESFCVMLPAAFITVFEIVANYHIHEKKNATYATNSLLTTSMLIKVEAILGLVMNSMGVVIGLNVGIKKDGRKLSNVFSALILIAIASSGSLCALFTTIPEPIVGALIFTMFLSAVLEGFDMLKFINLKSTQNIFVLGMSFFLAFFIPFCIREDLEITGTLTIDRGIRNLLSTNFIVAGGAALFLDNLLRVFSEESKSYQKCDKISTLPETDKAPHPDSPELCDCLTPFFA